jgi:hypothetical protein
VSNTPMRSRTSALAASLSVILPTASETALLRACLLTGSQGRAAWDVWQRETSGLSGLTTLSGNVKGLSALIHRAAACYGASVEGTTRTALRAAYLREELRTVTYRRICAEVLSVLAAEDTGVVVVGGAALADSVYEQPLLRHCHDLDLLVRQRDLSRAARSLIVAGFASAGEPASDATSEVTLVHRSGLPVKLLSRLLAVPWYPLPLSDIRARTLRHVVGGMPAAILSPADHLLLVCAHASYSPRRESLRWVCDSWFLIHRHPDLDWDVLAECAVRSQLALPLSVMLTYLARDIGLPIPATVLDRITGAAARVDRIRREVALRGARVGTRGSLKTLLRKSHGWRARGALIELTLFPSPAYLRWVEPVRGRWDLLLRYVQRPLRYALRQLRRRLPLAAQAVGSRGIVALGSAVRLPEQVDLAAVRRTRRGGWLPGQGSNLRHPD